MLSWWHQAPSEKGSTLKDQIRFLSTGTDSFLWIDTFVKEGKMFFRELPPSLECAPTDHKRVGQCGYKDLYDHMLKGKSRVRLRILVVLSGLHFAPNAIHLYYKFQDVAAPFCWTVKTKRKLRGRPRHSRFAFLSGFNMLHDFNCVIREGTQT